MSFILALSVLVLLLSAVWAFVLLQRVHDWKMGFLTTMLGIMAARQVYCLFTEPAVAGTLRLGNPMDYLELAVSVMGFLAVYFLERCLTERKRNEKSLREYHHHLEDLVREKTRELKKSQDDLLCRERLATLGQLTAIISHELRNPLGTIRTALFVIIENLRAKNPMVDRAADRAERSISRCDKIIEQLLNCTRLEEPILKSTNINDWISETLGDQRFPAEINPTIKFGSNVEMRIDRRSLHRCISNIIENACEAILAKADAGEQQLLIESQLIEDRLQIRISDTGIGIHEEKIGKVFEPLYSTKGFGVGLGLFIAKQIVDRHQGSITIESREGLGTTVTLCLPVNDEAFKSTRCKKSDPQAAET